MDNAQSTALLLNRVVQEKYGDSISTVDAKGRAKSHQNQSSDTESSTDSEEEDDAGTLISAKLDKQIQNTLEAIRRKDPKVYDENVTFYVEPEDEEPQSARYGIQEDKPMYLSDYHRRNLLNEHPSNDESSSEAILTYAQEQGNLKDEVVKELHATFNRQNGSSGEDSGDEGFIVRKSLTDRAAAGGSASTQKLEELNVDRADRDPEAYLSKFMSARAWMPSAKSQYQAFESDDEDEDRRAEIFEEAYNLRFEDPNVSNEKLMSHARDAAAKYSVRKEAANPRRKARELQQTKKAAAKQAREDDKARLRKLKVTELEAKISKIKDAAGIRSHRIRDEDWSTFFEKGWDDANWEYEMMKLFGDDYYAGHDSEDITQNGSDHAKKVKKPKWKEDINIDDLVPDFEDSKSNNKVAFSLTDDSDIEEKAPLTQRAESGLDPDTSIIQHKRSSKQNKGRKPGVERIERRNVERAVDEQMIVDGHLANFGKKHSGLFRYRETSPSAYGLTSNDILMADDSQLNQYAGLKKMATFRDSDKKRKDKKRLGKKARLRQWRKETFGNEEGPTRSLADVIAEKNGLRDGPYSKQKSKTIVK